MSDVAHQPGIRPGTRWALRGAGFGLGLMLATYLGLIGLLIHPKILFPYQAGAGLVKIHSRSPLPPGAEQIAAQVQARLSASLLQAEDARVDVRLIDEGWPVQVFFAGSQRAAGLTYPVISTRNVFLRHADIPADRLRPNGRVVPPPRTLTYFMVHEAAHLIVADRLGVLATTALPRWVHEGLADHAALGSASEALLWAAADGASIAPAQFGTYAAERICVTALLSRYEGDLDQVLGHRDAMPDVADCARVELGIAPAAPAS